MLPSVPSRITLVLTHACNLACAYCYMGEHHASAMPREVAWRALDLGLSRAADHLALGFFGGEPLIAWDLLVDVASRARCLAAARGVGLSLQVTTNATLLTPARAAKLAELGVAVAVSLDGTKEAHDVGRHLASGKDRGGGTFEAAMSGARAALDAGCKVDINAVITPENVHLLEQSALALLALGARRLFLTPAWERPFAEEQLATWERAYRALARLYVERAREGRLLRLFPFERQLLLATRDGRLATDRCELDGGHLAIAPSGRIYPCERLVADDRHGRFVIGHVETGLTADERRYTGGNQEPACAGCSERDRCSSDCGCANLAETGDLHVPGGTQCWHEALVGELCDEIGSELLGEGAIPLVEHLYRPLIRRRHLPTI